MSWRRWTASRACAACLCLFEGVVAGAADGYARMAGKPAATLLHLGPGFANAISFLHNARKAAAGGQHRRRSRHIPREITSRPVDQLPASPATLRHTTA